MSKRLAKKWDSEVGSLTLGYALGQKTGDWTAYNNAVNELRGSRKWKKATKEDHKYIQNSFRKSVK